MRRDFAESRVVCATVLAAMLVVIAGPVQAQGPMTELPMAWVTATTGFGVAGAGEGSRLGLFEIARLGGAVRVRDNVAVQVLVTDTDLLTASGSTLTDPRPIEPNLAGVAASLAFLSSPENGGLSGTTSAGLGAFQHRSGANTSKTYLGFQFSGDGDVYRLPVAGDLAAGGVITILPESHGNTEFMLGLTFGLRLY